MNPRIKNILASLRQKKLDALLVSSAQNTSYLTDSISRDSFLLVSKKANLYFTDSRYAEEAKDKLDKCFEVKKITDSVFRSIAEACRQQGIRELGFEQRNFSYSAFKSMLQIMPRSLSLIPTQDIVEVLRQTKSEKELRRIKKAVRITIAAFKFAEKLLKPGMRELEVAAEIERFIRYQGAHCGAFDIIVASGPNSSYPHHITSHRKLKVSEPVLIDMGVDYEGYKSDLTRV
ncbi:MAG: Xaa-Pro peptidase family protein, partial [Candidatus Omnitrophica bacterium]|nr:Xaa-Pro peptidase family protein [Candidatus Omnitrophota bacterium]